MDFFLLDIYGWNYQVDHLKQMARAMSGYLPVKVGIFARWGPSFWRLWLTGQWNEVRQRLVGNGDPLLPRHVFVPSLPGVRVQAINNLAKTLVRLRLANCNRIFWAFHPSLLPFIPKQRKLLIYDRIDQYYPDDENDRKFLKIADIVFTNSPSSQRYIAKYRRENVFLLPWGGNIDFLLTKSEKISKALTELKHPILGYLGTIDNRLNLSLLIELAVRNPNWSLLLLGPVIWWDQHLSQQLKQVFEKQWRQLRHLSNVHYFSPVPKTEIGPYLQVIDVGLIPYKMNYFARGTNSMKVYDYLAWGKPVVATPIPALKKLYPWVYLARGRKFAEAITLALKNDNACFSAQRKQVVLANSWLVRARQAWRIINEKV